MDQWRDADQIRQDTNRARKLVGTGEDLLSLSDVMTLLSPLLPIDSTEALSDRSTTVWSLAAQSIERQGIGEDAINDLLKAYEDQRNLMEALRKSISQ
jgi:hypothetical protein